MIKNISTLLVAGVLSLIATNSVAQETDELPGIFQFTQTLYCTSSDVVSFYVEETLKEDLLFIGETDDGWWRFVHANPDTQTWSITLVNPLTRVTCVSGVGLGYQIIEQNSNK